MLRFWWYSWFERFQVDLIFLDLAGTVVFNLSPQQEDQGGLSTVGHVELARLGPGLPWKKIQDLNLTLLVKSM